MSAAAAAGHRWPFYDSISLTVGQLKNLLPYDYDNLIQSLGREGGFFFVGSYTFPIGIDHRQLVQPTPGEINKKLEIQLAIELRDVVFITPTAPYRARYLY